MAGLGRLSLNNLKLQTEPQIIALDGARSEKVQRKGWQVVAPAHSGSRERLAWGLSGLGEDPVHLLSQCDLISTSSVSPLAHESHKPKAWEFCSALHPQLEVWHTHHG